jgi:hypothetical protein
MSLSRYVFWQMSNGQPYKKADGKFAPCALLRKIGETATVNQDGSISWTGFDLYKFELAVFSSAVIVQSGGRPLNSIDTWEIMWQAVKAEIKENGTGKPILSADLIHRADRIAASYFRRPNLSYVLVTSLSVSDLPAKRLRILNSEISPLSRRALERFLLPNALARRTRDDFLTKHRATTKYLHIKATTSGRTVHEATDQALSSITLLRGLWSLFATFGSWSFRMGHTSPKSMGVIHSGPVHTLHKFDGSPADDIFWFEPGLASDREIFDPTNDWALLEKNRRWATRGIKRLEYSEDVTGLVLRYAAALDSPDADVAFLQMWSILERMTDTVGSRYDDTIRRTTAIYDDRRLAKELLEHLRKRRNEYVHGARSDDRRDDAAQMIKSFVEPHLLRLIRNDFGVRSLKEYGRFLALPANISALESRRDQLERALKLHSSAR